MIPAFAASVWACSDDILETVPNDRLSSTIFWKTEADATYAANAVYTYLDDTNLFYLEGMTDIGHINSVTSQDALIERGQFDGTFSRILNEWTNAYTGIRAVNLFLESVDKVATADTELIGRLKGEVRVIRAYLYIKLVMLYGDVPLITGTITLEESRRESRTPADQVWDFIHAELAEAASQLPETAAQKGRVTRGAAYALDARAMLYAGRYAEAASSAGKVIGSGSYRIYDSYAKLFTYEAENNAEVILDKQFIKNNYSNGLFQAIGPWSQRNSSSAVVPTRRLIDTYETTDGKNIGDPGSGYSDLDPYQNRDPRLRYTVYLKGDILPDGTLYNPDPGSGTPDAIDFSWFSTNTGYNIKKYINAEDLAQPSNGGINIILIRYAEVLLTYAEAKIELNQLDNSVLEAINLVRQRSDVRQPVISGSFSQEELRRIVRNERTVELAFEGLRLYDIRRWRTAEHIIPGNVYGISYFQDGSYHTVEVAAFEKVFNPQRDYFWPVPQRELELSPDLTQNPDW